MLKTCTWLVEVRLKEIHKLGCFELFNVGYFVLLIEFHFVDIGDQSKVAVVLEQGHVGDDLLGVSLDGVGPGLPVLLNPHRQIFLFAGQPAIDRHPIAQPD